jgi:hypothetical protein
MVPNPNVTDQSIHPPPPPSIVGFTGGQIHLIDPVHKELSRLYNEERLLDKTKVGEYSVCIWTQVLC